ncbi:hypothetical protein [Pontimicrobium aquaticum]|uniref:Outer membrane protein beta-barrel domain-containing protein n=1 Tax=Pontimicrobium aquaticum TaxID=2565367 RepID=A0A4U0EU20_9FLAO|nr:hypothetical protein [Pontimicrobium aquaticum]TJY34724.1 hypothetical protein E5167_10470 [Pontimicrobium aquaticum]
MKNNKKHIDRLFQEGLKNFEATPNHSVWENVSEQLLSKKKQRKVIPLWIKLSAIAAGFLLLLTLGNNLFFKENDTTPKTNEIIVDTESQSKENINDLNNTPNSNIIQPQNNINSEDLANEEANYNKEEANNSSKGINTNSKNALINKNESIVAENNSKSTLNNNKQLDSSVKKELTDALTKQENNNTIASNSKSNKVVESQKNSIDKELSKTTDINTTIANTEINKEALNTIKETSIEDAIAENNIAKEAEESLEVNDETAKRWSVAPNIAPVYFNSLGSGSSIHSEFNNNSKTGNINVSYGVLASYIINDKVNLRVGLNNVKLGYDTHDVVGLNSTGSNPLRSIAVKNIAVSKSVSNSSQYINVVGMSFAQVPETLSKEFNSSINQELGFLEIPLEIQYKITNTKFGVNAIGGFSALFLNSNEIYSTLDGQTSLIGKATNINNLSYSANLGLGFNYKVSNNININLEPMFKYQLNTFRNTSGNFKPYFIGVYSGLSFRF